MCKAGYADEIYDETDIKTLEKGVKMPGGLIQVPLAVPEKKNRFNMYYVIVKSDGTYTVERGY